MIASQLPALQIVVPLLAAPVCILLQRSALVWLFSTLISLFSTLVAFLLLQQVIDGGEIVYALGGWAAPWGIEYRIDLLNALILLIVTGVSSLTLLFARTSVENDIASDRIYIFYTGWLLCLTGLLGMTITGDAFNVFVFLEISSLATYLLISLGTERESLTAAFQYLIMGTIGATFILIAIGLLYAATGTLNMADLAVRLPAVSDSRTVQMAFAFLTIGIALKSAIFPLHAWLPNAYTYAPTATTAFLAGTATKVSVYLLLRFFFTVFSKEFSFDVMHLGKILLPLALLTIFIASTVAIYQYNIKRLLAWSSIAQLGYVTLGISLASKTGLTATIVHVINHAMIKAALFMAAGCLIYRAGSAKLEDMAGIGKRMPWSTAAFVIGGFNLIGLPLTAGFISKWYLILAILETGQWWLAITVLLSSLLAVIYFWRIVEIAYLREPSAKLATVSEAPASLLVPAWALMLGTIYFGIQSSVPVTLSARAAESLLGLSP